MKKLLLIILVALTFASCKKETARRGENCYHCTFGTFNGATKAPLDYCGEEGRKFQDEQGNDLNSQCILK